MSCRYMYLCLACKFLLMFGADSIVQRSYSAGGFRCDPPAASWPPSATTVLLWKWSAEASQYLTPSPLRILQQPSSVILVAPVAPSYPRLQSNSITRHR
ncbi:hypothetical protein F4808DRAFT_194648 [Astrocystis sublimbata]|nr:hypothetical protein F4808DRAFT_194648 [Astrocystis sublimbata]